MADYAYYGVLVPLPIDRPILTYRYRTDEAPEQLLGRLVTVPLRMGALVTGVVWEYQGETSPLDPSVRIKSIQGLLPYPPIPESTRRLWDWVASYYMCSLSDVMTAALPVAFRPGGDQKYLFAPQAEEGEEDEEVIRFIRRCGEEPFTLKQLKKTFPDRYADLLGRWIEEERISFPDDYTQREPRMKRGWGINPRAADEPFLIEARQRMGRSKTGVKALERLAELMRRGDWDDPFFRTLYDVEEAIGISTFGVTKLREVGALEERMGPAERRPSVSCIPEVPEGPEVSFGAKPILLLQLPDTCPTERIPFRHLYRLVAEERRQVLLLFPSLELLGEAYNLLLTLLGEELLKPFCSSIPDAMARRTYLSAWTGEAGLYVGLRSAVWLPFAAPAEVVIVDCEHPGYRQWEPAPRFTASSVALMLAMLSGIRTLLLSAAPSVETMAQVMRGKYDFASVPPPERPRVTPVSVPMEAAFEEKQVMARLLSTPMVVAIRNTIAEHGTVLLLYRRPGYSRAVVCRACGEPVRCPHCGTLLRSRRGTEDLTCPSCSYCTSFNSPCPSCGSGPLEVVGTGVERLAEAMLGFFHGAGIQIVGDKKNSSWRGNIMLSSALEPPLSLLKQADMIGIVQLDLMMTPDYRTTERVYRFLCSCRDRLPSGGQLVIQYFTMSEALDRFLREDYRGLVAHEMEERHRLLMPPFCRQTDLVLEGADAQVVALIADRIARSIAQLLPSLSLLSPKPFVTRKRDRWHGSRLTLLIPLDQPLDPIRSTLRRIAREQCALAPSRTPVSHFFDVDP